MFVYKKIKNIKTRYVILGKGKPYIIIPGWRTDIERVYPFLEFLSDYYKVYCLDLPGTGKTEKLKKHTIENYSLFVNEWLKSLNLKNFVFSGISMCSQIVTLSLLNDEIYKKTKLVILWLPFYDYSSLRLNKLKIISVKKVSLLLSKIPFSNIGEKIYKSEKLMKLIINIFEKGKEAKKLKKPENLKYHLQSFKKASFKVTMETLHSMFNIDFNKKIKNKYNKKTYLLISKKDPLIDYKKTIYGYNKIYSNLKAITFNYEFHSPREVITKEYINKKFKKYFKKILEEL
ncbi:MAG: hypothetical protein QXM96_02530 [Candidatus Woesearchaeota archaeon]